MNNLIDPIVGFIKFSDFGISNGKVHFDELVKGNVFFQYYQWFEENGTVAQQAVEGSANRVAFLNSNMPKYIRGNIVISSPVGIKYVDNQKRDQSSVLINSLSSADLLDECIVEKEMESLFKDNADVVIYPQKYKITQVSDSGIPTYDFDTLSIKLVDPRKATWRISCFITVRYSDIDFDGKLTDEFLKSVLGKDNLRGSIAFDSLGKDRPWVWIPVADMCRELKRLEIVSSGIITYYEKDRYPYNKNQLLEKPNKLLYAKPKTYENQREFRLVIGGPNERFPVSDKLFNIKFWWGKDMKFGKELSSLSEIKLTEKIELIQIRTPYILKTRFKLNMYKLRKS